MRAFGDWRRLAVGALLLVLLLAGGYLVRTVEGQGTSATLDTMDHQAMVQAGMPCLSCHSGATRSAAAGIPSLSSCMGCHNVIKTDSPKIVSLAAYWARQEPISWPRVNQLPRFVYFSHQVHIVSAGLNCERCHGDVGHMTTVRPVVRMTMGWCLGCHQRQPHAAQLRDCIVCHQ
jgi:hypothetical protein